MMYCAKKNVNNNDDAANLIVHVEPTAWMDVHVQAKKQATGVQDYQQTTIV